PIHKLRSILPTTTNVRRTFFPLIINVRSILPTVHNVTFPHPQVRDILPTDHQSKGHSPLTTNVRSILPTVHQCKRHSSI
ncbi:unnamed protein product, partial [Staurois parvus]